MVIPARDEAERIAATVTASWTLPGVDMVIVVDDGSRDATSVEALRAGAAVVRHPRNLGKGSAMRTGAAHVARLEADDGQDAPSRVLLFVDADLGATAARTAALVPPVLEGTADMTVAVLPPQRTAGGGHGFVVRLSRDGIAAATGWIPTQPLSGMRCLSREAFSAALPLARGWGVETGLTIDLLRAGFRIEEVPCALEHRVTGRDLAGQLHRARQYRDVARALWVRRVRRGVAAFRARSGISGRRRRDSRSGSDRPGSA